MSKPERYLWKMSGRRYEAERRPDGTIVIRRMAQGKPREQWESKTVEPASDISWKGQARYKAMDWWHL